MNYFTLYKLINNKFSKEIYTFLSSDKRYVYYNCVTSNKRHCTIIHDLKNQKVLFSDKEFPEKEFSRILDLLIFV